MQKGQRLETREYAARRGLKSGADASKKQNRIKHAFSIKPKGLQASQSRVQVRMGRHVLSTVLLGKVLGIVTSQLGRNAYGEFARHFQVQF